MKERKNIKTDSELRRDLEMELQWDPSVDAREIGVAAKNGCSHPDWPSVQLR